MRRVSASKVERIPHTHRWRTVRFATSRCRSCSRAWSYIDFNLFVHGWAGGKCVLRRHLSRCLWSTPPLSACGGSPATVPPWLVSYNYCAFRGGVLRSEEPAGSRFRWRCWVGGGGAACAGGLRRAHLTRGGTCASTTVLHFIIPVSHAGFTVCGWRFQNRSAGPGAPFGWLDRRSTSDVDVGGGPPSATPPGLGEPRFRIHFGASLARFIVWSPSDRSGGIRGRS